MPTRVKKKDPLELLQEQEIADLPAKRVEALPESLRWSRALVSSIDESLLKIEDWRFRRRRWSEAVELVAGLSAAEGGALFKAVFPKLAPAMERAWRNYGRVPIGINEFEEGGRPFRSPGNKAVLNRARAAWFIDVCSDLAKYEADGTWLATWLCHVAYGSNLPWLMAAVLDGGGKEGDECLEILCACATGKHPTGEPDQTVIAALLMSERVEAWEFVEKLLLAAKREEGLRQAILEAVQLAHPEAFRRMLKLILDENLVRFSSVVRAADLWFGLRWDSMAARHVQEQIAMVLRFLTDEKSRQAALLKGSDANAAYLALWVEGFEDLDAAMRSVDRLLGHAKAEMRFVAVHLLADVLRGAVAPIMMRALGDEDLRVAARATDYFARVEEDEVNRAACFAALEPLYARVAATKGGGKLKEIVWPWTARKFGTREAGAPLVGMVDADTAERLVKYIDRFQPDDRVTIARYLGRLQDDERGDASGTEQTPISEGARLALVALLGDSAKEVRETAFAALRGRPIRADEIERLEFLLDRKAADLRAAALARLAEQNDDGAMASAERLTGSRNGDGRRAGVELLGLLAKAGRCSQRVRALAEELDGGKRGVKLDASARQQLASLRMAADPTTTLAGCLGLIDPSKVTPAPSVVDRGYPSVTPAAIALIYDLDRFIEANKDTPVEIMDEDVMDDEKVLGAMSGWRLVTRTKARLLKEQYITGIALEELWRRWDQERGPELRDTDGLELVRAALALATRIETHWDRPRRWPVGFKALLGKRLSGELRYDRHIETVLNWLICTSGQERWPTLILDAMETAIARGQIEQTWSDYDDEKAPEMRSPLLEYPFEWWCERLDELSDRRLSDEHETRLWRLYRAVDEWGAQIWSPRRVEQLAKKPRRVKKPWEYDPDDKPQIPRPEVRTILGAMRTGAATEADLIYYLLHVHPGETWSDRGLEELSRPRDLAKLRPPETVALVIKRVVARIVELELLRGDAATETSELAVSLGCPGGMHVALSALQRLGSLRLVRSANWWDTNKAAVFSRFIIRSTPLAGETPAAFAQAAAELQVGQDRLVQLAVYAPQWAGHVESALGWPGLVEAVWWIHAHTRDNEWRLEDNLHAARDAAIAERTPLTPDQLKDGAVDVAWFGRVYKALGRERWAQVYEAAKYACGGTGHKRAQLFADAMLGRVSEKELVGRIKGKRHQDSIGALGLLPLKGGKAGSAKQVLARYQVMQEIRRTSRKHGGAMLQASERRAVEIGMENLARAAGYPDPVRLQWAMEAEEIADLAKGPVTAKAGGVSVTLSIDAEGTPEIVVSNEGKRLASIPAAVKKDAKVAALTERVKLIRQQGSRMRRSLEDAMCRGDVFTGEELADLCKHPVLRPMLERLVFVGDGLAGYPDKGGRVLRSHDGAFEPLKRTDELRIAHPHDLLKSKAWSRWQGECFAAERVQPFKQVFRELYVLTERERNDAVRSTRYAGHQVQPRQALALLGQRGWVNRPDEGVQRTFHAERLTAWVDFNEPFYTPAEVEGLTLEAVRFTVAGRSEPVKLAGVPPRIFSEVMRDLDLVVSVAHRGGVDPEASESTVEARASLLRETCRLLKLTNVTIDGTRALIRGSLGDYSVHLGSATVQMMPGGSIWIVPVHAQHRGRIFLPFADDDPKTAEVISKVLLLARDAEIRDPTIRAQISRRS